MEMYIKNPNKKVSYSFRINPETLEDLKLYAKATNSTVPEVINQLITDKLDGVTLTNDYLSYYKDQLITVPDLQTIYDNTDTVKMLEELDLLSPFLKGTVYRVQKVPNNLDVWDTTDNLLNQHGYTSYNYPYTVHEGIEFVLAPELLKVKHLEGNKVDTQILLSNTVLLPIWFKVNGNNTLDIQLITFREAIEKVKQSNNFTLMDKLSHFKVLTDDVIKNVVYETPEDELYTELLKELSKIKNVINTGNIIINFTPEGTPQKHKYDYTNKDPVTELIEENKELKERVIILENGLDEIQKLINDPKARAKVWETLTKDD
jgi:hypothetical protein